MAGLQGRARGDDQSSRGPRRRHEHARQGAGRHLRPDDAARIRRAHSRLCQGARHRGRDLSLEHRRRDRQPALRGERRGLRGHDLQPGGVRHGLSGPRGGHLPGEVPDRRGAHLESDPTRARVADRRREPERGGRIRCWWVCAGAARHPRHGGGEKIGRAMTRRSMHFGVFVLGTGNHSAGWRYDGAATSNNDLSVIQDIARQAERGKFDLLFVSDGLVMDPGDHPSFLCRFEPTTLISALSASTSHIGLGATVSTSFGEPYHVARNFGSIDHITKGRAAWNVVPSSAGKAALNFSREAHMEHDLRYEVAQEFVDVVKGLWDCWEDGAIVADKATGVFIDPSKVRPLDHRGRFFQVKGPINMARCPQGHPVIIQAGGSEAGLELAARTADVVFSVVQELSAGRRAYRDLKGRMAKYGRTPDQLAVLPGMMPIIGRTPEEAREKLAKLQSWLTPTNAAVLVASRIGYDVSGHPLDGPVPPPPASFEGGRTFTNVLYERAKHENMTLRDLY